MTLSANIHHPSGLPTAATSADAVTVRPVAFFASGSVTGAVAGMGWLHSARFDGALIAGVAILALASGLAALMAPVLFWPILAIDLALLGYHHLTAVRAGIFVDCGAFRHRPIVVFALPALATAAAIVPDWRNGLGALATVFFFWLAFDQASQSAAILRAYAPQGRCEGQASPCAGPLFQAFFFGIPLWGVARRVAAAPETFLGLPFHVPPLPPFAADAIGAAAALAGAAWLGTIWRRRAPLLGPGELLYLLSHVAVFTVGYVLFADITLGWLVAVVWHGGRYALMVRLAPHERRGEALRHGAASAAQL